MSDNFDFVKKIIIAPPEPRKMALIAVFLGFLFGAVSTFVLSPSSSIEANVIGGLVASVFFYVIPAILSAEVTGRFAGLSRKYTYVMSIVDQVFVFLFSLVIPFTETVGEAWQVLWLGLATVYVFNLVMVLPARPRDNLVLDISFPLIFPGWTLFAFHLFIGRLVGIPRLLYLQNSVFFIISALLALLTLALFNVIIRSNISLSAFDFSSALILHEEMELEEGVERDVYHQSFSVGNEDGETVYNVPWLHPGPVEGVGGGRLTSELVKEGGFMLHVPSYHTLDLSRPQDIDLFRNPPEAETSPKASKMVSKQVDGFTLYGRRYGNGKIVYIENREIDDYDPEIAYRLKEENPELCLVDLHNQMESEGEGWLQAGDRRGKTLRDAVNELVEELDGLELRDYRAGIGGNTEYRALVEEVDGQETLLLGINDNDAPPVLRDLEDELGFDHTLVFTTDSHEKALEMANPKKYEREELEEAVRQAEDDVSDAEAGFGESTVENVKVLGKDYEALITTMNVMTRLVPISLLLYYIAIVFLIL
ncbi:MAG: DUF2070 family protein [Candidatus Nanohaloarchaea archaeon]